MKYILGEGLDTLNRFAGANVLLAFDYDGTLAPIVSDPAMARPTVATQVRVQALAGLYPCAVISGRKRSDALARLGDVQLWGASGNHGCELTGHTEAYEQSVATWLPVIRERLADFAGLLIENKHFSISIHYRNAIDERAAVAAIQEVASSLVGARILGGKKVVNILPEGAPNKGTALDCMRRWSGCDVAVYVGDDVTDEDAFALPEDEVLSVRVGRSVRSRAGFYLEEQREIDAFLDVFLAARALRAPGLS